MKKSIMVLAIVLLASLAIAAQTGNVLINWNANTESDLASYNVYWNGTKIATVAAPAHQWAGSVTEVEGTNKAEITAVDTSGNESPKSAPGNLTVDTIPPTAPTGCTVTKQ
jgi:endoglucanase